jgi:Ca-activated chloride channel family protein
MFSLTSFAVTPWLPPLWLAASLLMPLGVSAQKAKLPKPQTLERGVQLKRDPSTGELHTITAAGDTPTDPGPSGVIRSRVAMVEVGCSVLAPDGTPVRSLTSKDFSISEDRAQQTIASFDATTTPASIALLFDASPSIFRQQSEMRDVAQSLSRSLAPEDEVAVASFADRTVLLLPFSHNRDLLTTALASPGINFVADTTQSLIYQAVYLTARELFPGRAGRKAIVLLTDGQDSGLGLSWDTQSMQPNPALPNALAFEDVARELGAQGIELYVISTENRPTSMTATWLNAARGQSLITTNTQRIGIPVYTAYLAEMVRQVGGNLFFLHEMGSLAEIYHRIAQGLSAEYTLGYYPTAGTAQPGWRRVQVALHPTPEASAPDGINATCRDAYYVPASTY